jgi:hypothetical protein
MNISTEDLAYAAGFFDGEGCIGIWRMGNSSFTLVLNVTGTNQAAIMWWKMKFGGRIVRVCNSHEDVRRADSWKWFCESKKAKEMLEALLPYLKLKKSEAEIGLEFQQHKDSYNASAARNSDGRTRKMPDNIVQFRRGMQEKLKAQKRVYKERWWSA